ncbi:MAG: bacterioferritin [Acidobacteria bacterium RIFCSPLOWO2_02_FULL_68_18]|nr:MAG: bacterioferritin [Acidobacteria bacterium RIFCSPLOWO2_02_FULL_68_18]OFW49529.1 MAG: bacterioferritin [Acidobacteria bacterium RIFCSPLOWO2_12_FULL_68_19]
MRGNDKVIAELNQALREELTAINQYFVHAEMCHNWGYHRLGSYIRKQSIDEMKHAEALIERVLFLDGTPTMEPLALHIGQSVRAQIESDLKLEVGAVAMYNKAIGISRDQGDDQSRDLFSKLLKDEEAHVDWLETQLHMMQEMGYERYLTMQAEGTNE